jgi:hypothetical protein
MSLPLLPGLNFSAASTPQARVDLSYEKDIESSKPAPSTYFPPPSGQPPPPPPPRSAPPPRPVLRARAISLDTDTGLGKVASSSSTEELTPALLRAPVPSSPPRTARLVTASSLSSSLMSAEPTHRSFQPPTPRTLLSPDAAGRLSDAISLHARADAAASARIIEELGTQLAAALERVDAAEARISSDAQIAAVGAAAARSALADATTALLAERASADAARAAQRLAVDMSEDVMRGAATLKAHAKVLEEEISNVRAAAKAATNAENASHSEAEAARAALRAATVASNDIASSARSAAAVMAAAVEDKTMELKLTHERLATANALVTQLRAETEAARSDALHARADTAAAREASTVATVVAATARRDTEEARTAATAARSTRDSEAAAWRDAAGAMEAAAEAALAEAASAGAFAAEAERGFSLALRALAATASILGVGGADSGGSASRLLLSAARDIEEGASLRDNEGGGRGSGGASIGPSARAAKRILPGAAADIEASAHAAVRRATEASRALAEIVTSLGALQEIQINDEADILRVRAISEDRARQVERLEAQVEAMGASAQATTSR